MKRAPPQEQREPESLEQAVTHTLEEARMVVPGIQALLGFQLIAVFNQHFDDALTDGEKVLHLVALLLVGVSMALIMAPAAYHRQAEQGQASQRLLRVSSTLLSAALVPLMVGLSLDVYLVARVITDLPWVSAMVAFALLAVLAGLWFAFPQWGRARRRAGP